MPENIRAIAIILLLAILSFKLTRQFADSDIPRSRYSLWQYSWILLSVCAFLSPTFWIFAFAVIAACVYAGANRILTPHLYFMWLFLVPIVNVTIGGFGIVNTLLEINNPRLLSAALLVPILLQSRKYPPATSRYSFIDSLLLIYVVLHIIVQFGRTSFTDTIRLATVYALDILIPYFAVSRGVRSLADSRSIFLALVVAILPLAFIAVFETLKGWLLYTSVADAWGTFPIMATYQTRDGALRAIASAGSPITLGIIMMVGLGSLLALHPRKGHGWLAACLFLLGLASNFSRGPWIGTLALLSTYCSTSPNAFVRTSGRLALIGIVTILFMIIAVPSSDLLNSLPFVGMDAGSIQYRQRLLDNSLVVIQRNPWFGSSDYLSTPEMGSLIQGQGIVDIVNTYLRVALDSGLVGLSLFSCFFLGIIIKLWRSLHLQNIRHSQILVCIRGMLGILVAILVSIATVSSTDFIPYLYWSLAGLGVGLAHAIQKQPNIIPGKVSLAPQTG